MRHSQGQDCTEEQARGCKCGHGPTLLLRAQPPEYSSHENIFLSLPSMRESRSSTTIPSYFCELSLLCKAMQCPCILLLWGASPQLHTPAPPDLGSPHASPSAAAARSCPAMLGAGPSRPPHGAGGGGQQLLLGSGWVGGSPRPDHPKRGSEPHAMPSLSALENSPTYAKCPNLNAG